MYEDTKLIYERSINMKKLISLVLVVFMTAIIPLSAVAEVEPNSFDVNGDGKVNMFDYVFIKGIYFGSVDTVPEFDGADVNGDGTVNIFDCVLVKQAYLSSDDQVTPEEKDIPYTAHVIDANFNYDAEVEIGISHRYGETCTAYIITDFEQLDSLLDTCLYDDIYAGNDAVFAFYDNLAKDYFETKALIITPIYLYSGMVIAGIEGVKVEGTEIVMELSSRLYGIGTDDVQYRLMTAEVNKSDIVGCTSARGEIVDCNIYAYERQFDGEAALPEYSVLITDAAQLESIVNACNPYNADGFIKYAEALPEDFFDTKVLAVVNAGGPTSSASLELMGVFMNDQGIEIYLDRWMAPGLEGVDEPLMKIVVIELEKSDIGDNTSCSAHYMIYND